MSPACPAHYSCFLLLHLLGTGINYISPSFDSTPSLACVFSQEPGSSGAVQLSESAVLNLEHYITSEDGFIKANIMSVLLTLHQTLVSFTSSPAALHPALSPGSLHAV